MAEIKSLEALAVERARAVLDAKIKKAMRQWEIDNPSPGGDSEYYLDIADALVMLSDMPNGGKLLLQLALDICKQSSRHSDRVDISVEDLCLISPTIKAKQQEYLDWGYRRFAYYEELKARANKIIDDVLFSPARLGGLQDAVDSFLQ
jgi:hypothetical protein